MLILLLLCPRGTNAQNLAAGVSSAFDAANKLYAQGKFAEAAGAYEKLAQRGAVSPALYFNLATHSSSPARWVALSRVSPGRAHDTARPGRARQSAIARNQVQGPTLRPGRWERLLGTLSLMSGPD